MYCTTPKECLHHAASLPLIELLWEDERRREAIRWHTLDKEHTLRGAQHNPVVWRLRRLLLVGMETHKTLRPTVTGPSMPPRKWLSKEKEAEKHREEVDMAPVGTLIAYSDGSKDAKGNTGAGWVTTMDGATLETGHRALGKWVEVADAEAYSRRRCRKDAEEIRKGPFSGGPWSIVKNVTTTSPNGGQNRCTLPGHTPEADSHWPLRLDYYIGRALQAKIPGNQPWKHNHPTSREALGQRLAEKTLGRMAGP
ncbi:putative double-stranded RNA/RNA-DNA hybrid binding protein [Ceratocystis lukuohia]|uniref:Double-stranded RNA/RNA-DNA hybrid binding protein n=1 Tax=Ceratocystis lukuohia TaxID=2019550 RepID=A0ABR4MBU8_9PEZI